MALYPGAAVVIVFAFARGRQLSVTAHQNDTVASCILLVSTLVLIPKSIEHNDHFSLANIVHINACTYYVTSGIKNDDVA